MATKIMILNGPNLNFLGIRMDSRKAEGLRFTINFVTPDNGEKFVVEMANATLTTFALNVPIRHQLSSTIAYFECITTCWYSQSSRPAAIQRR